MRIHTYPKLDAWWRWWFHSKYQHRNLGRYTQFWDKPNTPLCLRSSTVQCRICPWSTGCGFCGITPWRSRRSRAQSLVTFNRYKIQKHTWLVVWKPLKNMKVSWDDDIPNIWENKKCSKPPTRHIAPPKPCSNACHQNGSAFGPRGGWLETIPTEACRGVSDCCAMALGFGPWKWYRRQLDFGRVSLFFIGILTKIY